MHTFIFIKVVSAIMGSPQEKLLGRRYLCKSREEAREKIKKLDDEFGMGCDMWDFTTCPAHHETFGEVAGYTEV